MPKKTKPTAEASALGSGLAILRWKKKTKAEKRAHGRKMALKRWSDYRAKKLAGGEETS